MNRSNNGTESQPTEVDVVSMFLLTMQLVIVALIIFGNTLTIVASVKFQFLRTVTNLFMVSLACSDLLLAFVLPLSAVHRFTDVINVQIHIWICWLTTIGISSSAQCTLLTLLLIVIDRFISVIYPFRYDELMTRRRGVRSDCLFMDLCYIIPYYNNFNVWLLAY